MPPGTNGEDGGMGAKNFSGSLAINSSFTMTRALDGIQPITNSSNPAATVSFTLGSTTANRANECYSQIVGLSAGATRDIDLAGSLTNVVGDTSISFLRIKALRVQLVSASQDTSFGTSASSISFGGSGATNPHPLFFGSTTHTHTVELGGVYGYVTPSQNGKTVSAGMSDVFRITNNDGSVSAAVLLTIYGADA